MIAGQILELRKHGQSETALIQAEESESRFHECMTLIVMIHPGDDFWYYWLCTTEILFSLSFVSVCPQVLLSLSCVLVSPKRKIAGRLEVMQSSLHFYGEFIIEGTGGRAVFNSTGGLNYPDAVTMEKGFSKAKTSTRKDSSMEGGDVERGNAMERLDPIQGGPSKGIKRHSRWDLSQVSYICVNL